jgi:hypothetical protein
MKFTEQNPYGAWISPKGDIIWVIKEECHAEVALDEILKRETKIYSVYRVMSRLKYIRIVFHHDAEHTYTVEYEKRFITKYHKEWIAGAKIDGMVDYTPLKNRVVTNIIP